MVSGQLPRNLSICRRSRFVGLPLPRSRSNTGGEVSRFTTGLWSTKQSAASGAPTRLLITRVITTIRCRCAIRASMRSPLFTAVAAFPTPPLTSTRPVLHSSVATARVGVSRTAHNQMSRRAVTGSRETSVSIRSSCHVSTPWLPLRTLWSSTATLRNHMSTQSMSSE